MIPSCTTPKKTYKHCKMKINKTLVGLIVVVIGCFLFSFCSGNRPRKTLKDSALPKIDSADEALHVFDDYCTSCHHRVKRNGFLWPSVIELAALDSTTRNKYLEQIKEDTIHRPLLKKIGDASYLKIKYYINSRGK
jgi:hypothetical protein